MSKDRSGKVEVSSFGNYKLKSKKCRLGQKTKNPCQFLLEGFFVELARFELASR